VSEKNTQHFIEASRQRRPPPAARRPPPAARRTCRQMQASRTKWVVASGSSCCRHADALEG
jgi:hypothetical protein